jgi:hypothetical protein
MTPLGCVCVVRGTFGCRDAGASKRSEQVAGDESISSEGENPMATVDPWDGLLDRVRTAPDREEESATKPLPTSKDEPRRRGVSSRRGRWTVALALALLALALARVVLPGTLGGGSAGSPRPAPAGRSTHRATRPHGQWRNGPTVAPRRRPNGLRRAEPDSVTGSARARRHHTALQALGHGSGRQREPEPSPAPPALTPSNATTGEPPASTPTPESALGSAERMSPGAGARGEDALEDGSHSSPEFGL